MGVDAALGVACESFRGAVHRINIVVTIMEKISNLFPGARLQATVGAAESFI